MPSPTRLIVRCAPVPTSFKGGVNAFIKALVDRLEVLSPFGQLQFQVGGVKPTSNVGPWLKDGTEWWVWDESLKTYVPITINPLSLTDVLADYYTKTEIDTIIANYSTTTAMNAAIAAAVSGAALQTYPAAATNFGDQSIPIDGAAHKVTFASAPINPAPAPFSTAASRYIAPVAGIYLVTCSSQFDNDTGTASGMEVDIGLFLNNGNTGVGDTDSTPSPNGARWSPGFAAMIAMAQNDYLEIFVTVNDGVNSGNINLTDMDFSVHRVG